MEWLTFWRGVKAGIKNFFRNGWLSVATISIIVLTLLIINTVFVITLVARVTLEDIQQKIDVSIYFKNDVDEREARALAETVSKMPEVKEARYVSKDEALTLFKEKHQGDDIIMQSLEELGNPLQPSMSVKMRIPGAYQSILDKIHNSPSGNLISDVDYYSEKKPIIEKLNNIIKTLRKTGVGVIAVFSVIAVLVTFNSIRLTMYSYRREVEIMKLVGANPWFIRLPFIVEGMMYGFFAAWISILLFYPAIYFAAPYIVSISPNVSVVAYLNAHALEIVAIQLGSGIILGAISSLIAIRKYLKI
jgi:cell division transport system permease protein